MSGTEVISAWEMCSQVAENFLMDLVPSAVMGQELCNQAKQRPRVPWHPDESLSATRDHDNAGPEHLEGSLLALQVKIEMSTLNIGRSSSGMKGSAKREHDTMRRKVLLVVFESRRSSKFSKALRSRRCRGNLLRCHVFLSLIFLFSPVKKPVPGSTNTVSSATRTTGKNPIRQLAR